MARVLWIWQSGKCQRVDLLGGHCGVSRYLSALLELLHKANILIPPFFAEIDFSLWEKKKKKDMCKDICGVVALIKLPIQSWRSIRKARAMSSI